MANCVERTSFLSCEARLDFWQFWTMQAVPWVAKTGWRMISLLSEWLNIIGNTQVWPNHPFMCQFLAISLVASVDHFNPFAKTPGSYNPSPISHCRWLLCYVWFLKYWNSSDRLNIWNRSAAHNDWILEAVCQVCMILFQMCPVRFFHLGWIFFLFLCMIINSISSSHGIP